VVRYFSNASSNPSTLNIGHWLSQDSLGICQTRMLLISSLTPKQAVRRTFSFCSTMSISTESPALSFEIIARCSVSPSFISSRRGIPFPPSCSLHSSIILIGGSSFLDHQSPRLQSHPASRPRPFANFYAGSNPSIPQRPHSQPTSPNRLQAMPQQHLSPRSQAWAGDPRESRRSPRLARMEGQYPYG
jgi:hypothetical protein